MTEREQDDEDFIHGIQILEHVQVPPRRLNDNSIRILQLTDLHLFPPSDTTWTLGANKQHRVVDFVRDGYDPGNKKCIKLISNLIDSVQPDLVIFTGDIVDGRPHTKNNWQTTFAGVIQPLLDAKPYPVPWTFCPGNHDDDNAPWSRSDLLKIFQMDGCITPTCTSFNHTFTIGIGTEVQPSIPSTSTRLWIFDSGGNHPTTRYDPFPAEAVQGYTKIVEAVRALPKEAQEKFNVICDLAFFHIPLPEYNDVKPLVGTNNLFNAILKSGSVPKPWNWVPWFVRCIGKHRIAGSSTVNSGMFDAMRRGNLVATFVGHDHYSDFVASNGSGPYMTYGRVTSYAPPSNFEGDGGDLPWKPGGRVVRVQQGVGASTWIETADGPEEDSKIILNGTHHVQVIERRNRNTMLWILVVVVLMLTFLWQWIGFGFLFNEQRREL